MNQWTQWRARRLYEFYSRLADELAEIRPDIKLVLSGSRMIDGPEMQRMFRPKLPQQNTMTGALLQIGFDTRLYGDNPHLVFLQPEKISSANDLASRGRSVGIDAYP